MPAVVHRRSQKRSQKHSHNPPPTSVVLTEVVKIFHGQKFIFDTTFIILNTEFTILNTEFTILNTKFTILNTEFTILNTEFTCHGHRADLSEQLVDPRGT